MRKFFFDDVRDRPGSCQMEWAVSHVKEWPQLVIIHSANPYGSERMKVILEPFVPNVQIIPYSQVQWGSIRWQ